MTNNNMWDCAERSFSIDDSSAFYFFCWYFWYVSYTCDKYIVLFRIKVSIRITKKNYVFPFEKKKF
jgi:hypothetical protein